MFGHFGFLIKFMLLFKIHFYSLQKRRKRAMMMEEVPLPQWWPRRWCDDVGSLGDFAYIDRKFDKNLNVY